MKRPRIKRLLYVFMLSKKESNKSMQKTLSRVNTYNKYNKWMKRWLMLYQENIELCSYFSKHGYKEIAIYGMGDVGQLLLRECNKGDVNVRYVIDRDANCKSSTVPIFYPNDLLQKVDCIILTTYTGDNTLKRFIESHSGNMVITFEEILDDITKDVFI